MAQVLDPKYSIQEDKIKLETGILILNILAETFIYQKFTVVNISRTTESSRLLNNVEVK